MAITMQLQSIILFFVSLFPIAYSSVKKGVAIGYSHYKCGDLDAYTNVHWWYDWQQTPWYHRKNHCNGTVKAGRVPMVWGWRHHTDYPLFAPKDAQYVLGFNEPNYASQSNLTAHQAAQHWHEIEARSKSALLVSPAPANCHTSHNCIMDSIQWLREFFRECSGCRIDFIAAHSYVCHASSLMRYLKELWNVFHKPIWLTEFNCPGSHSSDRELAYMKEVLPQLEAADFVYRYAWMSSRISPGHKGVSTTSSSLLHQTSSTLTTLGNYYNNFD